MCSWGSLACPSAPSLLNQCPLGFPHCCRHYGLGPELPVPGIPSGYTSHFPIIPLGFLYAQPSLNASPGLCGQNQLSPQLLNCCIFNHNTHQLLACTNSACIVSFSLGPGVLKGKGQGTKREHLQTFLCFDNRHLL